MTGFNIADGYILDSGAGFTDGAGREATALDVVQYREGERRGILLDCTCDGDAWVLFRDTKKVEIVKWHHLWIVGQFEFPSD